MRFLIPGANGQLGREIIAQLQKLGETVIPLTRQETDLTCQERLTGWIKDACPDIIINCAAYTQVDQAESEPEIAYLVNQKSVKDLALVSRQIHADFVHISTDFVFDGLKNCPYTEEDTPQPINVYGASKFAGEQELQEICPWALIIRTSWLYSLAGNNFVRTIFRLAKERESLRVIDDQIGSPTWARDLAEIILTLVRQEVNGIVHVSNEGVASWYDFALAILEEGKDRGFSFKAQKVWPVPTKDFPTPAKRPQYSVLSKSKLRSLIQKPIPHWRESLRQAIKEINLNNFKLLL